MKRSTIAMLFLTSLSGANGFAQEEEKKITFDEHIKPIFREHCTSCHSEGDKESDLALDSYRGALAGGSSGEVIASGNPGSSRLYALMTHAERPYMPPDQDPIAAEQLGLIKVWIEQGMPENSGSKIKRSNTAAAAMLGNVSNGKPEGPPPMPEQLLRQPVVETERSAAISAMAASPWAPLLAVGGQEQVVLYHSDTGELLGVIPFPEGEPQSLSFTRDGKQLLIGGGQHSHSGCAVLVDVATGERISKVGDELDIVLAADISPDKSRIALAGPQKVIRVFDTASGEQVLEMKKHTDWVYTLRYSPDGILLASGDRSNGLIVWEADTGNLYTDLVGHKGEVRSIDFRADSNVLASASLDGTVKLWDMIENREVKSWNAHGGGVTAIMYAQNGSIATAGRDSRVKLWNGNGELQKEFTGLSEAALEVALTGDATRIAGGDWNGKAQLWAAEDPNQTMLIAANPPSIEKRLELASNALSEITQEVNGANQAAEKAIGEVTAVQSQLTQLEQASKAMESQLAESTAAEQALQNTVAAQSQKIQELEQQLATMRAEHEASKTELVAATATVASLTEQSKVAKEAVAQAQTKMQELTANADSAKQKQAEAQARLAAAQAEVDRAQADKQALETKAAELAALAQNSMEAAKSLSEQMTAAVQQQQADKANMDKLNVELNALKDQLASLQKRLEEVNAMQAKASEQLTASQSKASEFQSQAEAAEQAALEAKEQLELFQQSYQMPQ